MTPLPPDLPPGGRLASRRWRSNLIELDILTQMFILLQWFGLETAKQHVWGNP
jgi:hypothetical protein